MNDVEDKKILSFGYEDTDKKIEIDLYGLIFEIKNFESIEEAKKIDKSNTDIIEKQLEKILGIGAIEKINKKRKEDGYCELTLDIELNIFGCIFEAYSKNMLNNIVDKVVKTNNDISEGINNVSNFDVFRNREQRRNYNKNIGNYKRHRNYRRY